MGRKPHLVMPFSFLLVLFAFGFMLQDHFDDPQMSWAPDGSQAVQDDYRI